MSYVTVLSVLVEAELGLPTKSVAALAGMEAALGETGLAARVAGASGVGRGATGAPS